jgi:hypothetical protein
MRRAMLVCVVVFVLGMGQLLLFAWIRTLWPATEVAPRQYSAPSASLHTLPTEKTVPLPSGQHPANSQDVPQRPAPN